MQDPLVKRRNSEAAIKEFDVIKELQIGMVALSLSVMKAYDRVSSTMLRDFQKAPLTVTRVDEKDVDRGQVFQWHHIVFDIFKRNSMDYEVRGMEMGYPNRIMLNRMNQSPCR